MEYDPLILRDQIKGQIKHALTHNPDRGSLVRLAALIEYLQSVVEDIDRWDEALGRCDCSTCETLWATLDSTAG